MRLRERVANSEDLIAGVLILFFSIHIWAYYSASEVYLNSGDGLHHYLIAKWSFVHPELLLDHWGKPLYTIFAAPFAQLGIHGLALMNIMASATAAAFGYLALKKLGNRAALIFIAVLYGSSIFYFQTASAGMTEVFMAMLISIMLWCWATKNWIAFALIASLLPYARPAGYLILLLAGGALIIEKKRKKLPLLLVGSFLFGLAGWPVYGTPFWYFTNDPYVQAADFYGRGDDLFHFIRNWMYIYGEALIGVGIVGLVLRVLYAEKEAKGKSVDRIYLFAFFGALGTLVIHSYLWWKGGMGSLGLIRVLASVSPLAAFSIFWLWDRVALGRLSVVIFTGLLTVTLSFLNHYTPVMKSHENQAQEMIISSMRMIDDKFGMDDRYFAALHPIVPVYTRSDPWAVGEGGLYNFAGVARYPQKHLEPGDIVVWEASLTAGHSGVSLSELETNPNLKLIHLNTTRAYAESLDGLIVTLAAFIFEEEDLIQKDTIYSSTYKRISSADEFYGLDQLLADPENYLGLELFLDASNVEGSPLLVCASEKEGEFYRSLRVGQDNRCVLRLAKEAFPLKIYVWNQTNEDYSIHDLAIRVEALSKVESE